MRSPFHSLSPAQIRALAEGLSNGRLQPPFGPAAIQRYVSGLDASTVASELQTLHGSGMQQEHLAYLLRAIVAEREAAQRTTDRLELVWTGPERETSAGRDTGVVVRELFTRAQESVYVAGFAVYNGRSVFKTLTDRMSGNNELVVRMFLNIGRKAGDSRPSQDVVREFTNSFLAQEWPGDRLPDMYHDPRAHALEAGPRSSLHAKCIIVDTRWSFITSANFTEAAQERNIEVGVVIEDPNLALALRSHLDGLIGNGSLKPI